MSFIKETEQNGELTNGVSKVNTDFHLNTGEENKMQEALAKKAQMYTDEIFEKQGGVYLFAALRK